MTILELTTPELDIRMNFLFVGGIEPHPNLRHVYCGYFSLSTDDLIETQNVYLIF
jgi:hypothetical protein